MPEWLHNLAIISLVTAGICALIISIDIFTKHPQNMWMFEPRLANHGSVVGTCGTLCLLQSWSVKY